MGWAVKEDKKKGILATKERMYGNNAIDRICKKRGNLKKKRNSKGKYTYNEDEKVNISGMKSEYLENLTLTRRT